MRLLRRHRLLLSFLASLRCISCQHPVDPDSAEVSAFLSSAAECDRCFDHLDEPVCVASQAGVTMRNRCFADCRGMAVECEGSCPCSKSNNNIANDAANETAVGLRTGRGNFIGVSINGQKHCFCDADPFRPVCGVDGRTYASHCAAQCQEVPVACRRSCPCQSQPGRCSCNNQLYPVCGIDGRTYVNRCQATRCNGVRVMCQGPCPCRRGISAFGPFCQCPKHRNPQCGVNGRTYGNECVARCHNVEIGCQGECPCRRKKICTCPKIRDPHCGTDGKTYSNRCLATCQNAAIACKGECPCRRKKLCSCPKIRDPHCGTDGKTYSNRCLATCQNAPIACKGECPCRTKKLCTCPKLSDPLCGADGKTYGNRCIAKCHNAIIECEGRCPCRRKPNPCFCPAIFEPVCGVDGKTYSNRCSAENCKGVSVQCQGQCPCRNDIDRSKPCNCFQQVSWVCGNDGNTYINRCTAEQCHGVTFQCQGRCPCGNDIGKPKQCTCPSKLFWVCGKDGNSYPNVCQANCLGVALGCVGKCPCKRKLPELPDVIKESEVCGNIVSCLRNKVEPVCGADGKNYGRPCEAKCFGKTEIACRGSCPCQRKTIRETKPEVVSDCSGVLGGCFGEREDRVCGADGRSYGNACQARCWHKTEVRCKGNCPCKVSAPSIASCVNTCRTHPPSRIKLCVRGDGNKNVVPVRNRCAAKCFGKEAFSCPKPIDNERGSLVSSRLAVQEDTLASVLADDQLEEKILEEVDGTLPSPGASSSPCGACTKADYPVCGRDGRTYANRCEARCRGTLVRCQGRCPCLDNIAPDADDSPDDETLSNNAALRNLIFNNENDNRKQINVPSPDRKCVLNCRLLPRDPVCVSLDGRVFKVGNRCLAGCMGLKVVGCRNRNQNRVGNDEEELFDENDEEWERLR